MLGRIPPDDHLRCLIPPKKQTVKTLSKIKYKNFGKRRVKQFPSIGKSKYFSFVDIKHIKLNNANKWDQNSPLGAHYKHGRPCRQP